MSKILIDLTTARQVLEALNSFPHRHLTPFISDTRTALREALAQPQQEPVAWEHHAKKLTQWLHCMSYNDSYFGEPAGLVKQVTGALNRLIGTSPQAQRKPLTDEEIESINVRLAGSRDLSRLFARAIEAAHGIKGDA